MPENQNCSGLRLLNRCIKKAVREKSPDDSIKAFIKEAGELLRAHGVYVFTVCGERRYDRTFVWREDGRAPKPGLQTITEGEFAPAWWKSFHEGIGVVDDEMERYRALSPEIYSRIKDAEIDTLVMYPVILGGEVYGLVAFTNISPEFLHGSGDLFEISANYIATQLQNRENTAAALRDSLYDRLTGVLSTNGFWNETEKVIKDTASGALPEKKAVVFLDIRHFKVINGTRGHAYGDRLLAELGWALKHFSGGVPAGRSTGDYFNLIVDDAKADEVAERIHEYMEHEAGIRCEIRAGIYTIDGTEVSASVALGRAKLARDQIASNRYQYVRRYDQETEKGLLLEAHVAGTIDEALKQGWVKVYYHPVMNLFDGGIHSYEALSRWEDPEYGFLSPAQFIGTLEQSSIIYKLDLYMVRRACEDLAELRLQGHTLIPVSVNISRHDLELPDLHERINACLDEKGLEHRLLAVEITESALMDNEKIIREHIDRFHADGYEVWLDDFGSGYSSLNAVQNYDFDLLKIDMQFLRHMNAKTPVILTDVVDMAKRTGMLVLAEGVENEGHYELLSDIGCIYAQGFYFSKPLPAPQIFEFMSGKGYRPETVDEHNFYEAVGRVNVLHSQYSASAVSAGYTGSRDPISIVVVSGGKIKTIYMNRACKDLLGYCGMRTAEESNNEVNRRESENAQRIWRCIDDMHEVGDLGYAEYSELGVTWNVQYRMIAKDKDRTAFLTTTVNPGYMQTLL